MEYMSHSMTTILGWRQKIYHINDSVPCCDNMYNRSTLREGRFILTHGFREGMPGWFAQYLRGGEGTARMVADQETE